MEVDDRFSEEELLEIIRKSGYADVDGGTLDELGERLSKSIGPPNHRDSGSTTYWYAVKQEMHLLVCTKDKKYAGLRRQLDTAGKKSQTAIVSLIAAAIASYVGVVAGVLVPLCALVLVALVRVGKNAFCFKVALDMPVRPN